MMKGPNKQRRRKGTAERLTKTQRERKGKRIKKNKQTLPHLICRYLNIPVYLPIFSGAQLDLN